jgi:hypothetical protein
MLLSAPPFLAAQQQILTSAPVDLEITLSKDGFDLILAKDLLQIPGDDFVLFSWS